MALGEGGRNPFKPRSTAEGVASLRAAGAFERDLTVRCPDGIAREFLGGFNLTSLARHRLTRRLFIRGAGHKAPGAYAYMVARCRVVDEIALAELRAGLDELVLLGAGLDSLPYRLTDHLAGVRIFEVDHPQSQASKQSKLRRIFGGIPQHVEFVAVDFGREDLGERLAAAGHDEGAATLFICTGVSMYLDEGAVSALLSWVSDHENPRTSIIFDAWWEEAIASPDEYFGARKWLRSVADMGEPAGWGIPKAGVEDALARFRLRADTLYEPADITARYLVRRDGSILGRPYDFGVIVHARPDARR